MSNICISNGLPMHQNFILKLFELLGHIQCLYRTVLIRIYFFAFLPWFFEFGRILELYKMHWIYQNWLRILQDKSKICIIIYCRALWVVKLLFDTKFWYNLPTFVTENTQNQIVFHAKIPKSTFGCPCKDMCYLSYNANVVILIGVFQQKYAEVKSLGRSGWTSNILLKEKSKIKLSVF